VSPSHNRPQRVGQLIQQRIGELFARGLRDPRLELVTITGTKVSPDLRQVRIYWTVHGDAARREEAQNGLQTARGFFRRELSELGLRVLPELTFTYDEAIDRGDRIDRLLREAKEADLRRAAEAAVEPAAAPASEPERSALILGAAAAGPAAAEKAPESSAAPASAAPPPVAP
jgi:ribosome-binding factor A